MVPNFKSVKGFYLMYIIWCSCGWYLILDDGLVLFEWCDDMNV